MAMPSALPLAPDDQDSEGLSGLGGATGYASYDQGQGQDLGTGPEDQIVGAPVPQAARPEPIPAGQTPQAAGYGTPVPIWEYLGRPPPPAPEPEKPGIVSSIKAGAAEFAATEVKHIANLAGSAARTIGGWTGSETAQKAGDAIDGWAQGLEDAASGIVPERTITEAYQKDGISGVTNWLAQKGTSAGLSLAEYSALFTINPFAAAGYLGLVGANQEARKPDATPASVAAAGATNVVLGLGGPAIMAKTPMAKTMAGMVVREGALMAGFGAAQQAADEVPDAIKSGQFAMPSFAAMSQDALVNGLLGAGVGAWRGRGAPLVRAPKPSEAAAPAAEAAPTAEVPPTPTVPETAEELAGAPTPTAPAQGQLPLVGGEAQPELPGITPTAAPEAPPPTAPPPTAPTPERPQPELPMGVPPAGFQPNLPGMRPSIAGDLPDVGGALTSLGPRGEMSSRPSASSGDPDVKLATDVAVNPPQAPTPPAPERPAVPAGAPPAPETPPEAVTPPPAPPPAPTPAAAVSARPVAARPPEPAPAAPEIPPTRAPTPEVKPPTPAPEPTTLPERAPAPTPPAPEARQVPPATLAALRETVPGVEKPSPQVSATVQSETLPREPTVPAAPPEAAPRLPTELAKYTTEPNHGVPGESVSKDPQGNVRGIGDTPGTAQLMAARRIAEQQAGVPGVRAKGKFAKIDFDVVPHDEVPGQFEARDQTGKPVALGDTPEQARRLAQVRLQERAAGGPPGGVPASERKALAERAAAERAAAVEPTTEAPTTVVPKAFTAKEKPITVGEALRQRELLRKKQAPEPETPTAPTTVVPTTRVSQMAKGLSGQLQRVQRGAGEARVLERAAEAGPTIETRGQAEGVPVAQRGITEARSAKVTSKNLHYSDLLHDVLSGDKTVEEALTQAGQKLPGTVGRPRTHQDFVSYLGERIQRAETEDAKDQALAERMNKVEAQSIKQGLSPEQRQQKLKPLLDQLARRETPNTPAGERLRIERERLSDLRDIRDEASRIAPDQALAQAARAAETAAAPSRMAEVTAKIEADIAAKRNQNKPEALGARTELSPEERDRIENLLYDAYRQAGEPKGYKIPLAEQAAKDGVNKILQDKLKTDEAGYTTSGLHNYLDTIINHMPAKLYAPHLVEIAKIVRKGVPDIPVTTFRSAEQRGIKMEPDPYQQTRGAYFPSRDEIALQAGRHPWQGQAEALVHEGVHAQTARYIKDLYEHQMINVRNGLDRYADMTPDEVRHSKVTDALFKEFDRVLANERGTDAERQALNYARSNELGHELYTQILTNPYAQNLLNRTRPSREFRQTLKQLGYGGDQRSVWQAVKDAIASFIGLRKGHLLDRVLDPAMDMVDAGGRYRMPFDRENAIHDDMRGYEPPAFFAKTELPTDRIQDPTTRETMRPVGERLNAMPIALKLGDKGGDALIKTASDKGSDISRGLRRTMLQGATTRGIVNHNKELLPGLTKLGDALANIGNAAKQYRDTWEDKVRNWSKLLGMSKDTRQLMNDATYARAHLGNDIDFDQANSHLTGDALTRAQELQAKFRSLSPENQRLYQEVRDYYRTTYNQDRFLQIQDLIGKALPNVDEETRRVLTNYGDNITKIRQLAENPDMVTELSGRFTPDSWATHRDLVQQVGRVMRQGYVQGDYFPLRRYGNWVVTYGDPQSNNHGVEYFERKSAADERRAELLQDDTLKDQVTGTPLVSQVLSRRTNLNHADFVPEAARQDLQRALTKQNADSATQKAAMDAFARVMLDAGARSEAARSRVYRSGVGGASIDQARALQQDFLTKASRQGHLRFGSDAQNAMKEIDRQVDYIERNPGQYSGKQAQVAQDVAAEVRNRQAPVDWDTSDHLTGTAVRGFMNASFLYHLMRPAHLAVQLADASTNGLSYVGARYGHMASLGALTRAMTHAAPTAVEQGMRKAGKAMQGKLNSVDWNTSQYFMNKFIEAGAAAGDMRRLNDEMSRLGMVDNSMPREIQRMMNPGGFSSLGKLGQGVSDVAHNMMNLFGVAEHSVDTMNRWVIAKAAYDLEMRRSGNSDKAIASAIDLASKAMPVYTAYDRPSIARADQSRFGQLAPAMLQYKRYGLHMYTHMATLARNAYVGQDRAEAVKALAGLVATHSLLIGAASQMFPLPVTLALGAWDWISGKPGPHNYETDMRRWVTDTLGPTAGTVFSKGVLGLAGIDLSRSLKLSNMMDLPEINSFKARDVLSTLVTGAMTGASGDVATQFGNAATAALNGDWGRAAQLALPRIVGDPYQAIRAGQQGVTDPRGNAILPSGEITPVQQVIKGLGFNPYEFSLARDKRQTEIELRNEMDHARQLALDTFVRSNGKDTSAMRAYNNNPQYRAMAPITGQQLVNALTQRKLAAAQPGLYGVRVPAKQVPQYREATRFQ